MRRYTTHVAISPASSPIAAIAAWRHAAARASATVRSRSAPASMIQSVPVTAACPYTRRAPVTSTPADAENRVVRTAEPAQRPESGHRARIAPRVGTVTSSSRRRGPAN
jgi:hypothetical protein